MPTYTGTAAVSTATTPYYQVRTYSDLLSAICRTAGIEPGRLLTNDSATIRDYINSAMREGWQYYPWPDLMRVTSDTVANIDNYATYDLFSINKYDPRDKRYPGPYTFSVDGAGINIIPDLTSTDTVYLKYRDLWYPFSGTFYSASTSYSLSQMSYGSSTGDYYRSLSDSNLGNLITNTVYWDRREIPAFLFEFIKWSAVAELREAEGQGEKSRALKARAGVCMTLEIEKWERQKNQQLRPQVRLRSGG